MWKFDFHITLAITTDFACVIILLTLFNKIIHKE